ncbi:MAG: hypothetical protein ABJA57_12975 [Ginsengibacter sp.]
MKKILLGLIAIASITLSANAQVQREQTDKIDHSMGDHGKGGRGHGGHMDGRMYKDLNLSDAQKQQMKSINGDFKSKMDDLNKHDNLSVKDFRAQRESLENAKKAQFESILTADQKNKLATLKNERGDKGNMTGRGGEQMEKMQSQLGLSNDQVARMKAERESFKTKAELIKNNSSLSNDQKKTQFLQLRKEREQNFKTFLNADQMKKFEEMKSKRWDDSKTKRSMKTT